jgi:hypothetical protein
LLRPHNRYVDVNGKRHRLVPGTAQDGLLLAVPAGADYPGPFALIGRTSSLAFYKGEGKQPSGRSLRITFKAMPIRR